VWQAVGGKRRAGKRIAAGVKNTQTKSICAGRRQDMPADEGFGNGNGNRCEYGYGIMDVVG